MTDPIIVPDCDSPSPPSVYVIDWVNDEPVYGCRCLVCSRCGHHTGNTSQGHYWSYCKVTRQDERFHMCCPDDCELIAEVRMLTSDVVRRAGEVARRRATERLLGGGEA